MKVVFMGTPDFAVPALEALHAHGHEIALVVCQPDRPAGRGLKLLAPPVKQRALALGLHVEQPARVRGPEFVARLREIAPDVIVVAAYGKILPGEVLEVPRHGCINVHASLLPRLRGAAPIHRAILGGEAATGVTIMRMDEGMDTGDMLLAEEVPISPRETAGSLHDRLSHLGARLIVTALDRLTEGRLTPVPQDHAAATNAPKLEPDQGRMDWSAPAPQLDRLVRGLAPFPGAYTFYRGKRLRVLEAEPVALDDPRPADGEPSHLPPPGTVLVTSPTGGIIVRCGTGALRLARLQPEGKRPQTVREFLAGRRMEPGERLGEPSAAPPAPGSPDGRPAGGA